MTVDEIHIWLARWCSGTKIPPTDKEMCEAYSDFVVNYPKLKDAFANTKTVWVPVEYVWWRPAAWGGGYWQVVFDIETGG